MYFATTDSFATGSKTAMVIDHGGVITTTRNYLQAAGSLRAPIFYDSDDTAYYGDFAGASVFNSASYVGNINFGTATTQAGPWTISVIGSGGATPATKGTGYGRNLIIKAGNSDNGGGLAGGDLYLRAGAPTAPATTYGVVYLSDDGGFTQAGGSLRAPIFYDSNDTAFYIDPASTSVMQTGQFRKNQTAGNYTTAALWTESYGNTATGIAFHISGVVGRFLEMRTDGLLYWNGTMVAENDFRAPIFYDSNDTGWYIDPNSYSRIRQLTLTQARVDTSKYPVGHYAPGEEVFSIDPTWTQDQLREYFNSNSVSWVADSTAPGGYAIQLTGAVNVGGVYSSGFPYIPVETDDTFYMEVYIKDVSGTNGHYMGSIDFNHNFSSLGGNPGSFGYWVMSSSFPGTGWTKYSGYISGFGTSTGQFVSGTKYWTPQALFNYSGGGTSYISGWKVYKLTKGIVGRFPNSTTNSGEAWFGRANDRNRGTYTIQLGGGSASGRSFEVVDYAWSSVMFSVDSGNYASAAGSFRAPIFYDSNDTAYYLDPTSTSRLGYLRPNQISLVNNQDNGTPRWDFKAYVVESQHHYGHNSSQTMYLGESNPVIVGGDIRSPIFYDSNNTGYYLDAASASRIDTIIGTIYGRAAHNQGHLRGGYNNIGASEGQTSPIYVIGSSYEPSTTTLGNMYGIGFTASGSFFPSGASDWGLYVAAAGVARIFLSGGNGAITATGNITAYASDKRLKTNIKPITNALDKLMKINGVEFDWIENIADIGFQPQSMHETGVIAQEIQAVIPDAVTLAPFNKIATDIQGVDNEYLTVDKEKIVPLLIEAIKEQNKEVVDLRARVAMLESLISKLIDV